MNKYLVIFNEILTKGQKKSLFLLGFILLIGMFFEILGLGVLVPIISLLLDSEKIISLSSKFNFLNSFTHSDILLWSLILLLVTYTLKSFLLVVITFKQSRIIENIGRDLSFKLFKNYLHLSYSFHVNTNVSQLIKNINVEITNFIVFCRAFLMILVELILTFSILLTIIYIEPIGALSIGFLFGILAFIYFYFTKKKIKNWGLMRENIDKNISTISIEGLTGIKTVKLFQKENYFENKFFKNVEKKALISTYHQTLTQTSRYYLELITVVGLVIFILLMLKIGQSTSNLISVLAVFVAATFRVIPSINRILNAFQNLKYYEPAIDIIRKELSKYNFLSKKQNNKRQKFNYKIQIQNMTFKYGDKVILENINFELPKGKIIGIIGVSGTGKSTFIDIICGLLKPSEGDLLLDGNKINDKLKSIIGYVGQDIYLFNDTILKNIAFGIDEKNIDQVRLKSSLKISNLSSFVDSLKEGLNTNVGDRGVQLSGGQRQRIGIARAIYNSPEILILDEATASLDNKTESDLLNSIYKLKGEKTIIMIAHRLSTLNGCDEIYEIKDKGILKIDKQNLLKNV